MKRLTIFLLAALVCVAANGQTTFKWKITKANRDALAPEIHREGLKEGDCWTFRFPVRKMAAGSYFEFDLVLGSEPDAPKYYAIEYLDGKQWKQAQENLHPVPENPELKYNVKCTGKSSQTFTVIQTLKFDKPVRKGELQVRLRVLGDYSCCGGRLSDVGEHSVVNMKPYGYIGGYARLLGSETPKDTTRIGWLGNSFTFVNSADFILKELAHFEGHHIDFDVNVYPGARFRSHFSMEASLDVIAHGGYDWFILQDQSVQAATYGRDKTPEIINYAKSISDLIRYFSPDSKILYEQTWAFSKEDYGGFGSFEKFDSCSTEGALAVAERISAKVSPIAKAFAIVRSERPDIEIYSTDYHHPAAYGAYLKACVNYLSIFGEPFSSDQANFALEPQTCAYLRRVAERVCLEKQD